MPINLLSEYSLQETFSHYCAIQSQTAQSIKPSHYSQLLMSEQMLNVNFKQGESCSQHAGASDGPDLPLSNLAEELGLDDKGLRGEEALSEHFEVACLGDIDDGDSVLVGGVEGAGLFGEEGPDAVDVDGGEVQLVALQVEHAHALLAEVAGMVAVHRSPVVEQTTGVTPTARVLSVPAHSAPAAADGTSQLSNLAQSGCHQLWQYYINQQIFISTHRLSRIPIKEVSRGGCGCVCFGGQTPGIILQQSILLMSTGRQEKGGLEQLYGENDFIDAKDNQGDWRVGFIVARYEHTKVFKVRFDGWPSKYDENYKFNSPKLKPFRTLVVGYTGQQQNPAIRDWKFLQSTHQDKTRQIQAFWASPESHSAHEINQLLRGHNYLYIDFLMTWKFASLEGIRSAIEYFLLNVKFLTQYLKHIATHLHQFLKAIDAPQEVALLSGREAYLLSYFEIFDGAYIISGSYPRLNGFFRDNAELIKQCLHDDSKREAKRAYQTQIITYFVKLGGMETIVQIIDQLLLREELIPFLFLQSLTYLFNGLSSLISTGDREAVIQKIIKIGESNLAKLKDHHFKDLHKHHVTNFLSAVVLSSINTVFQENILTWSIKLQLQLSLKMIACPYFERKLKGISHINSICEKNDFILKNQWFRQWMESTKLLQILFIHNDNHEFIKKACELVKFLNIKSVITDEDVDLIWKARLGKHETTVKEIYTLVSELPLYETQKEKKMELFRKVSTIPEEAWDQDYIKMIKEFSENCYSIDLRQKLGEPYGFDMVYAYTIRTQSQFSLSLMTSLLQKVEKSKVFHEFQEKCFNSIASDIQAEVHLRLLLIICNSHLQSFEKLTLDMIAILIEFLIKHTNTLNEKLIIDTLELLGEVVRSINKQMEIKQLMALWQSFMPSPHKPIFLKWLFRRRQNGRVVVNQALNQTHRSYLLAELWNKQQEIKNIEENEALFIVELVKCVNTFHQKMKRVNIIIRPLSLELHGYEKLWNILKYSQNNTVVQLICEFIAEINTCFEEEDLKLSIQNLVQNIAQQIKESLQTQDIDYISKLLLLTEKLILRDEQVYSYSYSPKVSYIREYTVVHQVSKEQRVHKFNCMAVFYDFKKMVADKWTIPLHRLRVFNAKHQLVKLQSYFKSMNENQYINYKFEIAEAEEQESFVQECLNKQLDLFFLLLDDKRIEKSVWSIVEKLPISDELKFKILEAKDILLQLENVGFYKELYELKVVLELSEEWWIGFTTTHNLTLLERSLAKASFGTHIELQYLVTLTSLIAKMLSLSNLNNLPLHSPPELFQKILFLLRDFLSHLDKNGSQSLNLQIKLIKNLFQISESLRISLHDKDLLSELLSCAQTENLFTFGLISISHLQIRKKFSEQLKNLVNDCRAQHWTSLLQLLLVKLLRIVVDFGKRDNLKEYFEFTSTILDKVPQKYLAAFIQTQGSDLCADLFDLVRAQKSESLNENANIALVGYLSLLRHLAPYEQSDLQNDISNFLLHECLFAETDCKCKSKKARWEALHLLRSLFVNPTIISTACSYLSQFHKEGKWRTRRVDDWVITLQDKMKSGTGYVGLKNLGCICYMNSFMQQLFMMPFFRHAITASEDPLFSPQQTEENLLFQVQKMFLNLQHSEKKFYNPKDFCNAFKDYEGNPTNVAEQMDIDEFSGILFDRLQSQLKGTRQETLIKGMFGGVFSNEIVCKGCPHFSETQQHFLSISLTVKHKKNIYQSFDTMIKGDTLDGDNAYFCERCSKKVSAVKRVSLKKLPDYLIVTLKRFEFDYAKMMKLKVNDYCEFPQELNLKEYSRQYLRKQQSNKAAQQEELEQNDYYHYILKGVVVHVGYADSGHYYSYIQDRNNHKWYEFNDTIVRDFSIDDLGQQAFGGEYGGYDAKEKIKNAYMLIYQRKEKRNAERERQAKPEEVFNNPVHKLVTEQIAAENREHKILNILFSAEYSRFVNQALQNLEDYPQEKQKEVLRFAITTYLTVTLREKSDSEIYNKLKRIHFQLQRIPQLKQWVVSLLSERAVFQEFFKNNMIKEVKKVLAHWLADLYRDCSRDCQDLFCNLLLNRITEDNENILECCLILHEIASKSARTLDYLVSRNVVGRFIQNIVRKEPRLFTQKLDVLPEGESEIGNEIIIQRTAHESSAKKLRLDNENGYIWALINLGIQRAREKGLQLDQYLTKAEVQYLWLNDNKIYKILQQIKNKFQMYEFLNLMAFLSTGNKEFTASLLALVCSGLKDFQSKRYRQFFLLFQKLISVQDGLKQLRLSGFQKIIQALMHNQQYSLDSNIIQQWVVILLNRNQHLRAHVANDQTILQYLLKMATKKCPSDEIARKNNSYGQFMINKYHGVKFPRSKKGYAKMGEDIADFYQQIIDKKFVQSTQWPSVLQTEVRELKVGEIVGYFDTKDKIDYEQAKIEAIFLGRVELSLKRNRIQHVWKDDQKLTLDVKLVAGEEEHDLNSSRTTEMDIDDDDDAFEEL